MIYTRYICDKCGKSFTNARDMKTIEIYVVNGVQTHTGYNNVCASQLYCDGCFGKLHIKPKPKKETTEQYMARPTLDEIIRDIIHEEHDECNH